MLPKAWEDPSLHEMTVSLGIVDPSGKSKYLVEATPHIKDQLHLLKNSTSWKDEDLPNGIFITHAHIGHFTGLIHLGREVMGAEQVPVFVMPQLETFLRNNGPWDQLIELQNIVPVTMKDGARRQMGKSLSVTSFRVPHRDEYSETVGYKIQGPNKALLFIPDIDKWDKWNKNIIKEIESVDYALLDGTFFRNGEIPGRDMSEIPHPFIEESISLFKNLPASEKEKIVFIHFNHTNPVLDRKSTEYEEVIDAGFRIAREGMVLEL